MGTSIDTDKARRVVLLRELKKHYEKCAERLGAEINKLGAELYDQFDDESVESVRILPTYKGKLILLDNRERIVKQDLKIKPTVHKEPEFFAWLRSEKCGEIIKEGVHPATLEAFIVSRKTNNLSLPAKEVLSTYDFKTVKVTMAQAPKSETSKGEQG